MAGLCKVMLIGNLGKDPELRYTTAGRPVATFSVAVNRMASGSDGERREETEWFQIVTFSRLAERCDQLLTKGQKVYVEGKLQTRNWPGPDGQPRKVLEVLATDVIFLGQRRHPNYGEESSSGSNPEDVDAEELGI